MYVRALIVVLIVLNAGVALWWALQPAPAALAAPAQPAGVARLEVLPNIATGAAAAISGEAATAAPDAAPAATSVAPAPAPAPAAVPAQTSPAQTSTEQAAAAASTAAATTAVAETLPVPSEIAATTKVAPKPAEVAVAAAPKTSPTVPTPAPVPERCASLGPYPARADADAALARIRGQATRSSVREDKDAGVSTFRVMLPNVGDRAAAQALVKRIAAAGIGDYYVIAQGEDNSVALGQYQSRERAERRQASLVSAGFPAQLLPSGTGQSRWWIDVRSASAPTALQGAAGATRQRSLDCSALR
ncbi:SPOR domain-containing protein [Xanthomonas hortorum]|uniref:SPOR domain-containing protein n=1 Tax=Xanthomonas hortorum pv. vitians TaxID=83224 RepID=A0AAW8ZU62_9XANT|nr:SPOR domain-containing protein [Xanthomonas hortorum]MDT7820741.1 SPOR domain-containing protein [Xanthomonas hortorum pv. vitians]MDT7825361.1 SPOR domain-containing protein [Xanthomonas hortorum pv. vitians]MDV7250053.1 SPOR domain-containing protein [Xanthomonas hortorum pv. vitians]NMI32066.1 SPOR domain-containing protein [Xanthomonas hortorum pv. vitians]NMI40184.1 SPOR domain-containing protein [Xanthomonas hortorum pv. vitians]